MKTTIDVPDDMLQELFRHAAASTKKQAILTAVAEYNQRRRMADLIPILGAFRDFVSRDELRKLSGEG